MKQLISKTVKKCQLCQTVKRRTQSLGHVPPKQNPDAIPWHTLCIDLIGPYQLLPYAKRTKDKTKKHEEQLQCLTMIDPATGWFEIASVSGKTPYQIATALEQTWLSRYPWPTEVVMDQGNEFATDVMQMLEDDYGVNRKRITTRNPQANSMVERAHQTVHNMIRTNQLHIPVEGHTLPERVTGILTAVGHAMRSTVHTTLRATPTQLVFQRDAYLNVNFQANWNYIKARKQHLITQNNVRENAHRKPHTYAEGQTVMVKQKPNRKHGDKDEYNGPFTINKVNDNGTVRLSRNTQNGGVVYETWNIRNIHPHQA